jgi:hypothetical protein
MGAGAVGGVGGSGAGSPVDFGESGHTAVARMLSAILEESKRE